MGQESVSLISSSEFSLVLGNKVVESISLLSVVVILGGELSLESGLVGGSLVNEFFALDELLLNYKNIYTFGSGELGVSEEGLSLEVSVFSVELNNSGVEGGLGIVFVSNEVVE